MPATLNRPAPPAPSAVPDVQTVTPNDGPPVPKFKWLRSEALVLPKAKAVAAAKAHQEMPKSPTERDLQPQRLNELIGRIKDGVWIPCCWATVVFDGIKYRMNGQHSSRAIIDANDFLQDTIAIHLDEFEAEDREQMAVLFRQFDSRISSRSKQDVAGAYQGLVHELDGVPREKAKLGVEGATWYERTIEGLPLPSGDELYESFFRPKYHAFIKWLDKVLSPWQKVRELRRVPVIGAAYQMFITSESGAQEFWPHVAKPDLPDGDPRSFLSQDLNRLNEGKEKIRPADLYAKCIKAWNYFRGGEKDIRSLNVNSKKTLPEIAA